MTTDPSLKLLGRLVGSWTVEATHPASPGLVVRGTVDVAWLDGERFLIHRSHLDHPEFPDSISIIGFTERDRDEGTAPASDAHDFTMHYFDSRGVFRVYDVAIDDAAWRLTRLAPGFSQRFAGTFAADGNAIFGRWQMSQDDVQWHDDLEITYTRGERR